MMMESVTESVCNICTDNLFDPTEDQDVSALDCGHIFHRGCLDEWWTIKEECPTCRKTGATKIDKLFLQRDCDTTVSQEQEEGVDNDGIAKRLVKLQENLIKRLKDDLDNQVSSKQDLEDERKKLQESLEAKELALEKLQLQNGVRSKEEPDIGLHRLSLMKQSVLGKNGSASKDKKLKKRFEKSKLDSVRQIRTQENQRRDPDNETVSIGPRQKELSTDCIDNGSGLFFRDPNEQMTKDDLKKLRTSIKEERRRMKANFRLLKRAAKTNSRHSSPGETRRSDPRLESLTSEPLGATSRQVLQEPQQGMPKKSFMQLRGRFEEHHRRIQINLRSLKRSTADANNARSMNADTIGADMKSELVTSESLDEMNQQFCSLFEREEKNSQGTFNPSAPNMKCSCDGDNGTIDKQYTEGKNADKALSKS